MALLFHSWSIQHVRQPPGWPQSSMLFAGRGIMRTRRGNSPGTKWTAFNAIDEHLDYGRRHTSRTNQVQRSFEDTSLKQRALELVSAA